MENHETLRDLLVEEIKDLYSAEKQLVKALPKMAAAAEREELRDAFRAHLAETEEHVARLERAASLLNAKTTGKTCQGMEGLIAEGAEVIKEHKKSPLIDLALISAASRVEHYEMAGYMSAIEIARHLGESDVASLLNESFEEETAAEEMLRDEFSAAMSSEDEGGEVIEVEAEAEETVTVYPKR